MTAENQTQSILEALEKAGAQNPDLSTYYRFHRKLFRILDQAKTEISGTIEMVEEDALQARLLQGLPLISFAQLPVEGDRFAALVSAVAQVLSDCDPDLATQTVPDSPTECLTLARRRFEEGQTCGERNETQVELTLVQTSVDLALKPYMQWAATQVLPYVDQERWKRGWCPVCGGAPDLATLDAESGARVLLCSRCNSRWRYRRLGCPFCSTTDHTKIVYYPSEDGIYRLYVCQECRHYLKTIDLRETARDIVLAVERITTVTMDVAAQQEGYRS